MHGAGDVSECTRNAARTGDEDASLCSVTHLGGGGGGGLGGCVQPERASDKILVPHRTCPCTSYVPVMAAAVRAAAVQAAAACSSTTAVTQLRNKPQDSKPNSNEHAPGWRRAASGEIERVKHVSAGALKALLCNKVHTSAVVLAVAASEAVRAQSVTKLS